MDFFMKSTTSALPFTESDQVTAQSTILRIYELFVRTTYDDFEEMHSLRLNVQDNTRTDAQSNPILTCMDEFTRAANQHGVKILRDTPKHFTQELSVRVLLT